VGPYAIEMSRFVTRSAGGCRWDPRYDDPPDPPDAPRPAAYPRRAQEESPTRDKRTGSRATRRRVSTAGTHPGPQGYQQPRPPASHNRVTQGGTPGRAIRSPAIRTRYPNRVTRSGYPGQATQPGYPGEADDHRVWPGRAVQRGRALVSIPRIAVDLFLVASDADERSAATLTAASLCMAARLLMLISFGASGGGGLVASRRGQTRMRGSAADNHRGGCRRRSARYPARAVLLSTVSFGAGSG